MIVVPFLSYFAMKNEPPPTIGMCAPGSKFLRFFAFGPTCGSQMCCGSTQNCTSCESTFEAAFS
jgi:hypothetical protein